MNINRTYSEVSLYAATLKSHVSSDQLFPKQHSLQAIFKIYFLFLTGSLFWKSSLNTNIYNVQNIKLRKQFLPKLLFQTSEACWGLPNDQTDKTRKKKTLLLTRQWDAWVLMVTKKKIKILILTFQGPRHPLSKVMAFRGSSCSSFTQDQVFLRAHSVTPNWILFHTKGNWLFVCYSRKPE